MQIELNPEGVGKCTGTVLAVGLLNKNLDSQIKELEITLGLKLEKKLNQKKFTAKAGDLEVFDLPNELQERLILLGLGEPEKLLLDDLRKAAAKAARKSIGHEGKLSISFPWEAFDQINASKAVGEAIELSLFKDQRFKSSSEPINIPSKIEFLGLNESNKDHLCEIKPNCAGVNLARELVGAPPNTLTPSALAEKAVEIAKEYQLKFKILEKEDCQKIGMGAYLSVSQGSDLKPKFIHLTYQPKKEIKRRIVLIGKGLTFDSGGYNLKVGAAQIDLMKFDMGGSAAVLGAARAIGELKPNEVEVHFIIASCENMINGSAIHPGDIIKASNGKTIEVNNTDAEGRLTLADALVYACNLKPDAIVDLATLTGACVIALGDEIAGLWTESEQLANELLHASEATGEGLWRMPMRNSYRDGLKSMLADLKNTGPRQGGSITAALFLKEFVENEIDWAHIDIAGPVWSDKDRGINPAGATGYGVRTLVKWICSI